MHPIVFSVLLLYKFFYFCKIWLVLMRPSFAIRQPFLNNTMEDSLVTGNNDVIKKVVI